MLSSGGRRFLHLLPLVICCVISAQVPANLKNMDLEAVDTSCKPCDDFYRFAIGKWNDRNPIPADPQPKMADDELPSLKRMKAGAA